MHNVGGWVVSSSNETGLYNIKLKKLFHQQSVKWNPETTFKGRNHIENGSFRCMDSKLGKPEIVKCLMPSNLPSLLTVQNSFLLWLVKLIFQSLLVLGVSLHLSHLLLTVPLLLSPSKEHTLDQCLLSFYCLGLCES